MFWPTNRLFPSDVSVAVLVGLHKLRIDIPMGKNAESNAEVKGLDVDALYVSHIQVNQAQKQRRPYMSSPCLIELILSKKEEAVQKEVALYALIWNEASKISNILFLPMLTMRSSRWSTNLQLAVPYVLTVIMLEHLGRYGLRKLWQEYEFCLVVTVEYLQLAAVDVLSFGERAMNVLWDLEALSLWIQWVIFFLECLFCFHGYSYTIDHQ
ncbi:hypothetical protein P8452_28317 [Trifolium repens]|nr:hypothetical protein P8452_28317 [Trifolium repens]